MKLVKLTRLDGTTKNGVQWGDGVTHSLPAKDNPRLCSEDVLHAYKSAEVAAFMRHAHAYGGDDYRAWIAEGEPVVNDGAKCGVFSLTILQETELPQPTLRQTVLFALFCAGAVLPEGAMDEAINAARREDYAAAARAARAAAYAADAADAAHAAAHAAYAAHAAHAARAAVARANAYADAARAAAARADADAAYAYAADAARAAKIDLHAIAVRALSVQAAERYIRT
jgi:hypothetical protein